MSDIFREVEEDVRRERLEKLWKQYGDYIIAGAAVLILGIAGYKVWQHYELQQQQKASAAYTAAVKLSEGGNSVEAAETFAKIAHDAPSGYAAAARLSEADALLAMGRTNDAIALYKSIAEKNKTALGDVARMRAAWAMADTASKADLQNMLAPLNDGKSSWRFMAREILAYSDYRDGAAKQALGEYELLAAEPDAPSALRQRATAMASLIRTGGERNYGTVPPPKPAEPLAQQPGTPDTTVVTGPRPQ